MKKVFTDIDMRHNRIKNVDNIYQKSEVDNIIKDLQDKIDNKVEKIDGKGLSTNDYTDDEKGMVTNYSLSITKVGSQGFDGMTKEQWDEENPVEGEEEV